MMDFPDGWMYKRMVTAHGQRWLFVQLAHVFHV